MGRSIGHYLGNPRTTSVRSGLGTGACGCFMSEKVLSAMAAFDGATSRSDYCRAKRLAARLSAFDQLCLVDCMIGANRRLRASGVL